MFSFLDILPTQKEQYEDGLYFRSECYRFYAVQRKKHCSYTDLMDLWLQAPYCIECASPDPFERYRDPDVYPSTWETDVLWGLGPSVLRRMQGSLAKDSDFYLVCKNCGRDLRPWSEEAIYIVTYHLEEHYGIPLETPGRKQPSKKLRSQIIKIYGDRCFNCGADKADVSLSVDHIMPQTQGGDSAFRNLQPLCEKCGNAKGDMIPNTVKVFSRIHFDPCHPDSQEEIFW
jgi:hypothetical protein